MELQVDRRASPEPMSKRAINRSESSARLSRLSGLSGLWVLPRLASIADAKSCTHGRGVQHGCKEMMIERARSWRQHRRQRAGRLHGEGYKGCRQPFPFKQDFTLSL